MKMKKMASLLIMLLALGILATAQEFGAIKGVVKDTEGNPLPGANVALTGSKLVARTEVTSERGNFRFLNLPVADDYQLKCELAGFKTYVREKLVVSFGKDVNLEIVMELTKIEEEVVVVGKTPVIDSKRTQVGINIDEKMIMSLPTARNPWVMMALIPGMLVDREDVGGNEGGQQSSYYGHGSSGDDNTWNVDGANITDNSALGAAPAYLNISSYEEIQVNYGNNDIRSQTGGVQINLVSKRGSNKYSGSFYLDAETNSWQSDNVPAALKARGYTAAGINKFYLYGANFGGPIVKDRAWFYGSYGIQDIDALTLAATSDKTWLASGYARLDLQLANSTRANFFLEYDNKQKWGRAAVDYTQQGPETLWNQTGPGYLWKGEIEQMFGKLYLNAKAIFTNSEFALAPVTAHTNNGSGAYMIEYNYPQYYMSGNIDDYGTTRDQLNVNLSGTYFAEGFLAGDHEFRFGVDYVGATTTTYDLYEGTLKLEYQNPDPSLPTGQWWEAWLLRDYRVNDFFTRYSAFLQDTMTYGRLAINLGIRYDQEKSIVRDLNIPAALFLPQYLPAIKLDKFDPGISWKVFSPRLSVSYDLFGNGKDVIKLSIARYGSQSGNTIADFINPVGVSEIDVMWQDLNGDGRVTQSELFGYNWDTGQLMDVNDPNYWLYRSSAVNPDNPTSVAARNKFDPNYNSPMLDELSFSYEKELFTDFAGRLEFFYKRYHNQTWTRKMLRDGTLETAANYYVAGYDADVGYNYYGRDMLYPYRYRTNHQNAFDRYLAGQLVVTKRLSNRWMLDGSFTYSDWKRYYKGEWLGRIDDIFSTAFENGINNEQYFDGGVVAAESGGSGVSGIFVNSRWIAKLAGLYQLPFGINFSGVFTAREGYVKPTNVNVSLPGIGTKPLYGSPGGNAGKFGDERLPAFWVLNFRLEKVFQISDSSSVAIAADAFNVTNSADSLKKETRITSTRFNQDLRILNPRVFRFGVRFNF